ncbi:MAG: antitoxin MazE family protein [Deltaproteobacteria bacterium]|nr:antitoxin MazE family protein [Deltaproteobacteria bacterium]
MPTTSRRPSRTSKSATSRDKVQAHRRRLRAQGLRPIQIWVPDVRSPKFAAQASRQSRLVAASSHAAQDQAFIDAVSTGSNE